MLKIKTELLLGIASIVVVIFLIGLSLSRRELSIAPKPLTFPVSPTGSADISLTQLAQHNLSSDCWVAVNGTVYNLTSFTNSHPGGAQAILANCGADGSVAFNTRAGKGPHKLAVLAVIATLKVGSLAQ